MVVTVEKLRQDVNADPRGVYKKLQNMRDFVAGETEAGLSQLNPREDFPDEERWKNHLVEYGMNLFPLYMECYKKFLKSRG